MLMAGNSERKQTMNVIQALKLPSTYRKMQSAKGNLSDGSYIEVAFLQSSTDGNDTVYAAYQQNQWREITESHFTGYVRDIFKLYD